MQREYLLGLIAQVKENGENGRIGKVARSEIIRSTRLSGIEIVIHYHSDVMPLTPSLAGINNTFEKKIPFLKILLKLF